jgi:20S proteasome subunit alpha 6
MRGECANHKFVYESTLQTTRLVNDVADKHQRATQSYVRRPYGVGLLVAGYDRTGPHIFQTCPSGNFYEWKSFALGARSQSAKTYIERNFDSFAARECASPTSLSLSPSLSLSLSRAHIPMLTPLAFSPPLSPALSSEAVSREELLREAAKALHQCLEAEKELDVNNCVLAIVGKDESFRLLEGAAVASYIAGLGQAAQPGSGAGGGGGGAAGAAEGEEGAEQPAVPPPGGMEIS